MSLHVSPLEGAAIVGWSFLSSAEGIPKAKLKWKGRDMYFINFTTAKKNHQWKDIRFWIDIEVPFMWNKQYTMDIGFSAHFLNYYDSHTEEFKTLVNNFPSWTNVQHWTACYEGYQY